MKISRYGLCFLSAACVAAAIALAVFSSGWDSLDRKLAYHDGGTVFELASLKLDGWKYIKADEQAAIAHKRTPTFLILKDPATLNWRLNTIRTRTALEDTRRLHFDLG